MQLSKLTISLALTGIVYGAPSLHKGGQDSTILRAHLSNTPNQASDLETRGRFADYGGLATIALVIYNAFKPTKPTKRDDHDDETLDFTGSLESRDDVDVLPEKRLGKLTPERAVNLGTAVGLAFQLYKVWTGTKEAQDTFISDLSGLEAKGVDARNADLL